MPIKITILALLSEISIGCGWWFNLYKNKDTNERIIVLWCANAADT
jgi:hypothetical protein